MRLGARAANHDANSAETFITALSRAQNGDAVVLTADIGGFTSEQKNHLITSKNITINLNSHTLDLGAYPFYVSSPNALTIFGNTGAIVSGADGSFAARGTLVVFGGSSLVIEGGRVYNTSGGNAIYKEGAGTVTVSGGEIVNNRGGCAIYHDGSGAIAVSGGTVNSPTGTAINNRSTGAVNVSAGRVLSDSGAAVYNYSSATVTVSGGEVKTATGIAIENIAGGTANVTGGKVYGTSSGTAIKNNSHGAINISGSAQVSSVSGNAINNNGDGSVTISGGTVHSDSAHTIYGYSHGGSVSITGGTVSSVSGCAYRAEGTLAVGGSAVLTSATVQTQSGYTLGAVVIPQGSLTLSGGRIENTNAAGYAITKFIYGPLRITGAGAVIQGGAGALKCGTPTYPATPIFAAGIAAKAGADAASAVTTVLTDANCESFKYIESVAGCTVSFDTQGHGAAIAPQFVASGDRAARPADPAETGYSFGGWYKQADCTDEWDFNSDTVSENTTIYAKWTALTTAVTFNRQSGTGGTDSVTATYGAAKLHLCRLLRHRRADWRKQILQARRLERGKLGQG